MKHEREHPPGQTAHPLAILWSVIGGLLALIALVAGMIAAWHTFVQASSIVVSVLIVIVGILIPLATLGLCVHLAVSLYRKNQREQCELDLARKLGEAELEHVRAQTRLLDAETDVKRRTITFDSVGNAAVLDASTGQILQLRGNYQEHPALSSLHYNHKIDGAKADQAALPSPVQIPKPTIEEIVSFIKHNSYAIVLGRSLSTRELITVELLDAHIKLIGGSRMGKSCEAAAIIDQACKTHDPQHLLLALLDLEYKTSRLFEHDPHVLTIKADYKHLKMHAKDVKQVAEALVCLHDVMLYRYTLTDAQVERMPHVLIYLEEFLYWKKLLGQFVSPQLREKALAAFAGIATRGLKVGLHLMACAQVDYADDELKDAMAQFLAVNIAFSVKPSAAQAAGFVNTELLKKNYADRTPGQFVVEAVGGADLGVAPEYDVRAKLKAGTGEVPADTEPQASYKTLVSEVPEHGLPARDETQAKPRRNTAETQARNEIHPALQAKVEQVMHNPGENMADCIKRVWGATPGDNAAYRNAKQEYIQVQQSIHALARKAMRSYQDSEDEGESPV
jgi:FtsK/SpoIIIE family